MSRSSLLVLLLFVSGHAVASDVGVTGDVAQRRGVPASWDWLAGTYWYVPQEDLPSYLYDTQTQSGTMVPDQTVFHITESAGGYFRGSAVVQIGASRTAFVMLGVVAPDGSVLLNFLPAEGGAATTGTGKFTYARRQLAMLNQMSSSPNERLRVLHWAYMLRTQEGDATWNQLPGVGVSVPTFLGTQ